MAQFLQMPEEILHHIFWFLDFISILQCTRLCRLTRVIIDDSPVLQYLVELGIAGYQINPAVKVSPDERMGSLYNYLYEWKQLSWEDIETIPISPWFCTGWELCRGVFIRAVQKEETLPPGTLSPSANTHFMEIINIFGNSTGPRTRILELGFECRAFSFDPGQDLLAAFSINSTESKLHFLSLTSGKPHPRACIPTILLNGMLHSDRGGGIQIVGDIAATIYSDGQALNKLCIYDWKSGKRLVDKYIGRAQGRCFTLLSNERYILWMTDRSSSTLKPDYSIGIFKISGDYLIAKYDLPPLHRYASVISLRCDVAACSTSTADDVLPSSSPFIPHSFPDIIVFTLRVRARYPTDRDLTFVVPRVSFFPTAEQLRFQESPRIAWDDWGPANSRWFRDILPAGWEGNMYSYKLVTPSAVLDFNLLDIERDLSKGAYAGIVTNSSFIPEEERIFSCNVTSSLPYRVTHIPRTPPFPEDYEGGLLADHGLISVETVEGNWPWNKTVVALHIFRN